MYIFVYVLFSAGLLIVAFSVVILVFNIELSNDLKGFCSLLR